MFKFFKTSVVWLSNHCVPTHTHIKLVIWKIWFGHVCISCGKHLLAFHVHLPTCINLAGFLWKSILENFMEICQENLIWVKIRPKIQHFNWRPECVCTVDISIKYFVAWQNCKGAYCCVYMAAPKFYIANKMRLSNAKVRHCCAFIAVPAILYPADVDIRRSAFPWQ
jgi:hypothetical protein